MATPVTLETSSWASSTISTSCCGRTGGALDGVDREQRVIGDDDLRELGPLTGHLGEALRSVGAFGGAETLPGRHRDLAPGPVGDTGCEVVAVAGLGLVRPVAQPQQVLAQLAGGRGRLELVEESLFLVLRHALVQAVQAQVVRPALEHREFGAAAQQRMQRVDGARQVALHELPLEREGGCRDDHPLPVRERGDQVSE